jgi:putative sigma-54 modulation protein
MEVIVSTRNLEPTPRLQEYVERKVNKLDRYLPDIDEAQVDLKVENTRSSDHRQVAQLTVRTTHGTILRAEERTNDMFASIDAVLDKMYRQVARYKGKRQARWQGSGEITPLLEEELTEEQVGELVRVKRFQVRPMSPEEAIEQMELLGHEFYVFLNAEENAINVLYRRTDANYGLLQPELA